MFLSATTKEGVYFHICKYIGLTWNRKKPLRANLKEEITQRFKIRMHSNNDFANKKLCHIKIYLFL